MIDGVQCSAELYTPMAVFKFILIILANKTALLSTDNGAVFEISNSKNKTKQKIRAVSLGFFYLLTYYFPITVAAFFNI